MEKQTKFDKLSREQKIHLLEMIDEYENRHTYKRLSYMFADSGEYAREYYPKHIAFMNAGLHHKERAAVGGNRTGKSTLICVEGAYHLLGEYPDWWKGKRFYEPILAWFSSKSHERVKETSQLILLGPITDIGSGLIPKDRILDYKVKAGIPNAIAEATILHSSGRKSTVCFKAYTQGREEYQGTAIHYVGYDEEPPVDVYAEGVMRTMTTNGLVCSAFTPQDGITEATELFLPDGMFPPGNIVHSSGRFVVQLSWEDNNPHLTSEMKADMIKSMLPHELEARTKGIPSVGSGKIIPFLEADYIIDPIKVMPEWKKWYGMDVGWHDTVAVWVTQDPKTEVYYVYDEYYGRQQLPEVHAAAIRSRGSWMSGGIDPASKIGNQKDGGKLLEEYQSLGLNVYTNKGMNALEPGIVRILNLLTVGKLKICYNCVNLIKQLRTWRRDDKGDVVRKNNHAPDAMRYALMSSHLGEVEPDLERHREARIKRIMRDRSRDETGY